jgi:hypothetical protein
MTSRGVGVWEVFILKCHSLPAFRKGNSGEAGERFVLSFLLPQIAKIRINR